MPKSYHEPRKAKKQLGRKRLFLWGGFVVIIFSVGLLIGYFKTGTDDRSTSVAEKAPESSAREVILYFASYDGQSLAAEARTINECMVEEDCLRDTVQALIAGPENSLAAILPEQVALRGVTVVDSLVTLDFSRELITAHPGGTQSELLTVYGLADTLAVNFPHLRQVLIKVEGASVTTLKGHVDLRQPIIPDFSLVEEGLAPVGKMSGLPAGREE
jgi:spore germination protein GerM